MFKGYKSKLFFKNSALRCRRKTQFLLKHYFYDLLQYTCSHLAFVNKFCVHVLVWIKHSFSKTELARLLWYSARTLSLGHTSKCTSIDRSPVCWRPWFCCSRLSSWWWCTFWSRTLDRTLKWKTNFGVDFVVVDFCWRMKALFILNVDIQKLRSSSLRLKLLHKWPMEGK